MNKQTKKNRYSRALFTFLQILPGLFFLGIWQWFVWGNSERIFLFSSPSDILIALYNGIAKGYLLTHTWVTFLETFLGFLLGNFVGIILGLSLWGSKLLARILRPYIIAIGSIPVFAIAPVLIIWFGIGIFSKIMMAALSTVVIALVQSFQGAMSVDEKYLMQMKVFNATKLQTFMKVVLPSSLIWVFSSLKINIGFALLGAFIGEFISAEKGLGYFILKASGLYDMANVFAGLVFMIALAIILSKALGIIEDKVIFWK
ncbi:MAG: ABC transporter permease [Desulfobulbaceae bacterium]|nr:ABC transporter permease [Desulfobulbaceae bacterium]